MLSQRQGFRRRVRWSFFGLAFLASTFVGAVEPSSGSNERRPSQTDVAIRLEPRPAVRVISGNLVYEEHLYQGAWRSRYWSPDGLIKPDSYLKTPGDELPALDEPIAGAFGLSVDGQELWDGWQWKSAQEVPCETSGCRHVVVELASEIRPIRVRVHTRIDGNPFLKRWLEITNDGKAVAAIGSVYPMSGYLFAARDLPKSLPADAPAAFSVLRPASFDWIKEGDFRWVPLPDGNYSYGASYFGMPFAVVRNAVSGESFALHFAWSSLYTIEFYNDHDPLRDQAWLYWRVGPSGPAPVRVLRPGETVTTPAVHLGHFQDDLDGVVQASHRYLRESVIAPLPPGRVRPVETNSWGIVGQEISESSLKSAIDVAADVGIELFMIDAGWYADVNSKWSQTVGDWKTGSRLPNGLEPIFDYARKKGMLCGLWVDIERIGTASEIGKKHPDWVVKVHGSREGRTVIDFTNPEAAKYAEETLARLIERYKLDVFRLDFNTVYERGIIQDAREGFVETTFWRHYEALYAMYGRLRKRFPNLMMENCAAGGGRNDLGMFEYAHWAQMSDESTPTVNLRILNGFTLALPPELGMGFVGMMGNENYRYGDLDFRFRIQLFGHLCVGGIAPSLKEFPAAYREQIRHHVELYKSFMRPILPTVKAYHHTPVLPRTELGDWAVMEYATPDQRRGYAGIFRLGDAKSDYYLFCPRGLDVSKSYKVTFDNTQNSVVLSGLELQERGLNIRISQPLHSELLLFEAQ